MAYITEIETLRRELASAEHHLCESRTEAKQKMAEHRCAEQRLADKQYEEQQTAKPRRQSTLKVIMRVSIGLEVFVIAVIPLKMSLRVLAVPLTSPLKSPAN